MIVTTDHVSSTCPDSTCSFRNSSGYCSLTACVMQHEFEIPKNNKYIKAECNVCKYDLDDEDYLYKEYSQDGAIVFEEIICHYCPVCGRKLIRR